MSFLFDLLIAKPLLNALVLLYTYLSFNDLGVAIILFTIFVRILLFPIFQRMLVEQKAVSRLQPHISRVKRELHAEPEAQAKAILGLYREHRVNPFSGFFLLFLQLPILFALFSVINTALNGGVAGKLYSFVPDPGALAPSFLGLINLGGQSMVVVVFAALAQFLQSMLSVPVTTDPTARATARIMAFIAPGITLVFFFALNLSNAIGLYWITTSLFSVVQQLIVNHAELRRHSAATP